MWCSNCRQEVPGLVDGLDGRYACPRCGTVLLNDSGIDLTGDLAARRKGPCGSHLIFVFDDQDVRIVDRAGADPDQKIAGTRRRIGHLGQAERFGAAGFGAEQGLHWAGTR